MSRSAVVTLLATCVFSWLCGSARAQTTFHPAPPNHTKPLATPAIDAAAGDLLLASGSTLSPNIFRVRLAPRAIAPWRIEVRLFNGVYDSFLLGRTATVDNVAASSYIHIGTTSGPPLARYLCWYGFGRSEEAYVDLRGSIDPRTGAVFEAGQFVISPAPEVDLGAVPEQPLVLSARALQGARDLELHVFDAEWNALPYGSNDDAFPGASDPRLTFDAPPGVYHLAVADRESASHLPPDAHDLRASAHVLDFAGGFTCNSPDSLFDVEVVVLPGAGGSPLRVGVAQKFLSYEVLFFRLQVGTGQSSGSYCRGDEPALAPCGCGGNAPTQSGMGCLNSTGRGATAIASDHLTRGHVRVTLEDLPPHTTALGFAALSAAAPAQAHGGLSCIGAGAVRLGLVTADGAGSAALQSFVPTAAGFLTGQSVYFQAAYRDAAAAPGCQINFTNGFRFLVR